MKSNTILKIVSITYLLLATVLPLILCLAYSATTPREYGFCFGKFTAHILIPLIIAFLAWLTSGRKMKVAYITIIIFVTIGLAGELGRIGNEARQTQILNDMQGLQGELKKDVLNADDPSDIDSAYSKMTESYKKGLDGLKSSSTGLEKEFYEIMGEYTLEFQAKTLEWAESYDSVLSTRILDYSLLTSDEEFSYQRNVINQYIDMTKDYDKHFNNTIPELKKRLSVLGEDCEIAQGGIKGATDQYLSQKPFMEPLMQEHIQFGNNLIKVLELLQNNKDEWAYKNDELLIFKPELILIYNRILEDIGENEMTIYNLSLQMLE